MSRQTETVEAGKLQEGDLLPGLDNGYVFEVEEDPDVRAGVGRHLMSLSDGEGWVLVTFHTQDGDEAFLLLPADLPVEVTR